jgi:hypothetical protein
MRAATRPEPVPPEGEEITLTVEQVTELIKVVQSLIRDIEVQQKELSENAKANLKAAKNDDPETS